jgi:MYXO-CTERM domain-containing protein
MKRDSSFPALLAGALLLATTAAKAGETTLDLSGAVSEVMPPEHERVAFEVPAGTREIEVRHEGLSSDNVLDWGLDDPKGFRGWGGGNTEPAIVGEHAASRSYLAGPIEVGTWHVVIGKALLKTSPAPYSLVVILRDAPTLPAQPERKPYVEVAPLSSEARWYAGDLHVHSIESGDARPPIDEIAAFAKDRGLDYVELSDHNTTSQLDFIVDAQARHPALLLVPGVEFTTYHGHANGIGATRFVDHKLGLGGATIEGALQSFEDQGALFSLNHPTLELGDLCLGCAWELEVPSERVRAIELVTSGTSGLFTRANLDLWDRLSAHGARIAAVGGSDDHGAGQNLGTFGTPIGTPTTMIFAQGLSVSALLDGIRSERTVVKVEPSDPMVELRVERSGSLRVVVAIAGGAGTEAIVVRNGVELSRVDVGTDNFEFATPVSAPATGTDRYRIHVEREGALRTITSHVWVEAGADPAPAASETGCGCRAAGDGDGSARGGLGALALAVGLIVRRRVVARRR